jgi:hypothetical protein
MFCQFLFQLLSVKILKSFLENFPKIEKLSNTGKNR